MERLFALLEELGDESFLRFLQRALFQRLYGAEYVVSIAYRAIRNGFEARFTTADRLIGDLSAAATEARLEEANEPFMHLHELAIDGLGYQSYAPDAANVLYRVVNDRDLKGRPMTVTTNKPLAALGELLHDGDPAQAIPDRFLERGIHFVLRGRSCRTRHLKPEGEDKTEAA